MSTGEVRQLELRLRQLESQIQRLNREMDRRPIMNFAKGPLQTLEIIDGQTLYSNGGTTIYGIQRKSSALATVSTLWDPTSVSTAAGSFSGEQGIGRAWLYINGTKMTNPVLVVHDNRTGNLVSTSLVNLDAPQTYATVSIPLVSDGTQFVTAYVPFYP